MYTLQDTNEKRTVRVGLILFTAINSETAAGLIEGLERYGYREGDNVEFVGREIVTSADQLDKRVAQVIAADPDVIVSTSTPGTLATQKQAAPRNIPVIFAPVNDPVASGIVADYKQPGGNVTGIRLATSDGKRFEWLLKLKPSMRKIYIPYTEGDPSAEVTLRQIREVAKAKRVDTFALSAMPGASIEKLLTQMPANIDGIFLPRDSRIEANVALFAAAAEARGIPLAAPSKQQVDQGALFCYGFEHRRIGRQAARLVAEVLKGTAVGNLPVETAENYTFLNMKSVNAIGLEVSDAMLRQMDEIIR
ncbi:hypothetical protein BOW53_04660 [Solemya pervernicosa gill symbiont]|uniref:ABC transporter substrate-binding protein n=2 Tax=Solemya pervernicosa gill symbiont TaxID=642797 RepID=A0A1T2L8B3_9GAMM|nr:hypothetical protein BOW53_04660 [Solemya pervernicosa gill symbiont]